MTTIKFLTDIKNNLISSKEVNTNMLPPDKTFFVEIYKNSKEVGWWRDIYACTDFNLFQNKKLVYNKQTGFFVYVLGDKNYYDQVLSYSSRGRNFPYFTLGRDYSCFNNLAKFSKTALKHLDQNYKFKTKSIKYSFGLEFETSNGIIPEHECYQKGLIPLHDGSITGIEYSSIVLEPPFNFDLLYKQLELLKQTTVFDKNCALHIHFGGFPVDIKAVYLLFLLSVSLENDLSKHNCPAVFKTDLYKDSGKNYCKDYQNKLNYAEFCYIMSGGSSTDLKDLRQDHPNDREGDRKWNINIRYYWINFINILFFNRAKTIEFRFLRPTYNFNKIVGWIYIFNAFLLYAEKMYKKLEKDYNIYQKQFSSSSNNKNKLTWYQFYLKQVNTNLDLVTIVSCVYEETKLLPHLLLFLKQLKKQASYEYENDDLYGKTEITTDEIYFNKYPNLTIYDS